jgi:hypothetical protein
MEEKRARAGYWLGSLKNTVKRINRAKLGYLEKKNKDMEVWLTSSQDSFDLHFLHEFYSQRVSFSTAIPANFEMAEKSQAEILTRRKMHFLMGCIVCIS